MTDLSRIGRRPGTALFGLSAALLITIALPAKAADTTTAPAATTAVPATTSAAPATTTAAAAEDKTLAVVNGLAIKDSDIQIAAEEFADQLARIPPAQQKAALLTAVIDIRLIAQAAEAQGLDKTADGTQRLDFARARALRNEFVRTKVIGTVTDEAVKKAYDEETAKFVGSDELHLLHILVKTEDEAKAIIADLDKGGDFAAIAKEKSIDPGSGKNGGDLGFISRGQTVKPFEDAAFALEVGTYTKTPVQSDYGWHVIRLEAKRKAPPPTFEQRAETIRQQLISDLFSSELDALRKAAKVEITSDQPDAAPGGSTTAPAASDSSAAPAATTAPADNTAPATPATPAAPAQ